MTLTFSKTAVSLVIAASILAACGGGATAPSGTTPLASTVTPPTYVTLTDTTSTRTSPLAGSVLASNTTTGQFNVNTTEGALVRATDVLTLSDGEYLFKSTGGIDLNGTTKDAQGSTLLVNTDLGTGYDYATVYNGTYVLNGVEYDALGVVGTPTAQGDLPTDGTATYTGNSNLTVATENELTHVYSDGAATVFVNFKTGRANVTVDDFTVRNPVGLIAEGSFDKMQIFGMAVDGAAFAGGSVTFENDGQAVDVVGDTPLNASQGTLFGYDPNIMAPDEAGGVILVTGDTSQVTGAFIAD
ncbi:MAG: hypothetical protein ACPG5U_12300 [Planktomarina sp.]